MDKKQITKELDETMRQDDMRRHVSILQSRDILLAMGRTVRSCECTSMYAELAGCGSSGEDEIEPSLDPSFIDDCANIDELTEIKKVTDGEIIEPSLDLDKKPYTKK